MIFKSKNYQVRKCMPLYKYFPLLFDNSTKNNNTLSKPNVEIFHNLYKSKHQMNDSYATYHSFYSSVLFKRWIFIRFWGIPWFGIMRRHEPNIANWNKWMMRFRFKDWMSHSYLLSIFSYANWIFNVIGMIP